MIYRELNKSDFIHEFARMDRKDNFSYDAREILFEFYSDFGGDFEMDVIAICCDWTEASIDDIRLDFDLDEDDYPDDESVLEYLNDNSYAVETSEGILYQNF